MVAHGGEKRPSAVSTERMDGTSRNETPALMALASASARRETEALLQLTARVNDALRSEDIYEPALDAVLALLHVERASILLFDADGVMRFKAFRGLSERYRRAVEGHSPWARGAVGPRPFCTPDVAQDEALRAFGELFREERIASLAFIPLVCRGELLGKFMAYSEAPRRFSERELALGEAVATQVAQACARASLMQAERSSRELAERSADRMQRLLRTTARLSNALYAEEVMEIVVEEGTLAMGSRSAGLWLLEDGFLRLCRSRSYTDEASARLARIDLDEDMPITRAVRTSEAQWLESYQAYASRFPSIAAETRHYPGHDAEFATAAVPLTIRGTALGVLAVVFTGARTFEEPERAFLSVLARHCADALERARLYRETQAAEQRSRLLAQISALLATSLDTETTLRNVAEFTVPTLADWCAVELASGGPASFVIKHADPAKTELALRLHHRYRHVGEAGIAASVPREQPVLYELVSDECLVAKAVDAEQLAGARALGVRSAMIVPMRAHGDTYGTISFVAADSGRRFGAADLALAVQIGERAGVALHNAGLYQQAVNAVRVRDEFLSIAGHELRTPLTALLLQVQSLLKYVDEAQDPARAKQRAERLTRNVTRLTKLVDELLDVTRISSGRLALSLERVDLNQLVHEVVQGSHEQFERAKSTVRWSEHAPVIGRWDRHRIEQVVLNLLSNALKYGGDGPIDVEIAGDDREAVLRVRDHGIGISADDQSRIFGRFERAVSSRNFGGLGLGLWIARCIVEAHGGSIGVASEQGQGAEFIVRLPLDVAADSA